MKQRTLHLVPLGGLCNRMRAIDSALALAQAQNRRLRIYWMERENLKCPFNSLFEPFTDSNVGVFERKKPPRRFLYIKPLVTRLLKGTNALESRFASPEYERLISTNFDALRAHDLDIMTFINFYSNPDPYSSFKPIREILDLIAERTSDFDPNTVGVHIRRTDHVKAIANSPDEAFFHAMDNELHLTPSTRFYLATDSMQVKETFKARYGEKIVATEFEANRSSIEGIREAVVELYSLSGTKKIIGSQVSSFSTTAAEIGKIPIIRVTRESTIQ